VEKVKAGSIARLFRAQSTYNAFFSTGRLPWYSRRADRGK
jgi:hypothetical protein